MERNLSKKIDRVIFDFDGTLYDSHDSVHKTNYAIVEKYSRELPPYDEFLKDAVFSFEELFQKYPLRDLGSKKLAIAEWYELAKVSQSVTLYTGAVEVIQALHQNGIELSIWTARDRESTMKVLTHHDLLGYFSHIHGSNLHTSKPNLENLSADFLTKDFSHTLMVGDSPTDQLCAVNLKCLFGWAKWDCQAPASSFLKEPMNYQFEGVIQIPKILKLDGF